MVECVTVYREEIDMEPKPCWCLIDNFDGTEECEYGTPRNREEIEELCGKPGWSYVVIGKCKSAIIHFGDDKEEEVYMVEEEEAWICEEDGVYKADD